MPRCTNWSHQCSLHAHRVTETFELRGLYRFYEGQAARWAHSPTNNDDATNARRLRVYQQQHRICQGPDVRDDQDFRRHCSSWLCSSDFYFMITSISVCAEPFLDVHVGGLSRITQKWIPYSDFRISLNCAVFYWKKWVRRLREIWSHIRAVERLWFSSICTLCDIAPFIRWGSIEVDRTRGRKERYDMQQSSQLESESQDAPSFAHSEGQCFKLIMSQGY